MEAKTKKAIIEYLESRCGTYTALSLHPPKGETVIQQEGNRMYINKKTEFEGVSELFYDEMVSIYDTRYKEMPND